MSAVLGVSLLCLAALWFAAILPVYRRPAPPRWATIALVAELMTVGILSVGVFGLAFLIEFALTAATQGFSLVDGALVLAVVVGAGLLWRRLPARRYVTAPGRRRFQRRWPLAAFAAVSAFFIAPAANAETQEERMGFLMDWAGDVAGYGTEGVELPPIVYLTPEEMQIKFYGDLYFQHRDNPKVGLLTIHAIYNHKARVLFLQEGFTLTPETEWMFVHEITHHLQAVHGAAEHLPCLAATEKEAYEVQDLWVRATGKGVRPDPLTVRLIAMCDYHG